MDRASLPLGVWKRATCFYPSSSKASPENLGVSDGGGAIPTCPAPALGSVLWESWLSSPQAPRALRKQMLRLDVSHSSHWLQTPG